MIWIFSCKGLSTQLSVVWESSSSLVSQEDLFLLLDHMQSLWCFHVCLGPLISNRHTWKHHKSTAPAVQTHPLPLQNPGQALLLFIAFQSNINLLVWVTSLSIQTSLQNQKQTSSGNFPLIPSSPLLFGTDQLKALTRQSWWAAISLSVAIYITEPASPSEQNAHVLLTIFAIIQKAPAAGKLGQNTKQLTTSIGQAGQRKAEPANTCPLTAPSPTSPYPWCFAPPVTTTNRQSPLSAQQWDGNQIPGAPPIRAGERVVYLLLESY